MDLPEQTPEEEAFWNSMTKPLIPPSSRVGYDPYVGHTITYSSEHAPTAVKQHAKDAVNPDHYKVGGIEAIDYMRAKSTPEEFKGYLRLSALKYLSRVGHKHGNSGEQLLEEYRKAQWFLNRLVDELGDKIS